MHRASSDASGERRRHPRFELGLPVTLNVAGRVQPIVVELVDLSPVGGRFRALTEGTPRLNDRAAFQFVIPGQRHCSASGRCVRVRGRGEFALVFEAVNPAFLAFVKNLASEPLGEALPLAHAKP